MVRLIKPRKQISSSSDFEPSLPIKFFASGLFTGYFPAASGTLGSAIAVAFYFIPGFESPFILGFVLLLVFGLGIKASSIMEKRYGHDPAEVTIDEVVGMWITLFFLPKTILVVLAAFFVFRFFDIVKPFPARELDKMHGGFGIMMDDVVAGIYANITMQIFLLIPFFNGLLLR
jgi:phosphatidylglycerophosphatase A